MRRKSPPHLWNWENPIPLKTFQLLEPSKIQKTYVSSKKLRFTVGPSKSSFFTNINNIAASVVLRIYIYNIYIYNICIYIYIHDPVREVPPLPPEWDRSPGSTLPFYSQAIGSISEVQSRICQVFAASLTTSLPFTRYMLPFRRPASHTYSLKVPTCYLQLYIHVLCIYFLYIFLHVIDTYICIYIYIYVYIYICIYIYIFIFVFK